jgi:DNA-binding response OmpR family regulator
MISRGANAFMQKPFEPAELLAAVEQLAPKG